MKAKYVPNSTLSQLGCHNNLFEIWHILYFSVYILKLAKWLIYVPNSTFCCLLSTDLMKSTFSMGIYDGVPLNTYLNWTHFLTHIFKWWCECQIYVPNSTFCWIPSTGRTNKLFSWIANIWNDCWIAELCPLNSSVSYSNQNFLCCCYFDIYFLTFCFDMWQQV